MAQQQCPNCGQDLPSELGQHASAPMSGQVTCPSCGTDVNLGEGANETPSGDFEQASAAPPGRTEGTAFSGNETVEETVEEARNKQN
jgi:endogenous inhibitor of DNA gyrase (YacG/DUF329 family)